MILGRSTVQWTALITAGGALAQVVIVNAVPNIDATLVATIIGALVTFLGVFIAFLANTQTTPISDPILAAGTTVSVKDTADKVVIAPTPPGPTGIDTTAGPTYTTPDDDGVVG